MIAGHEFLGANLRLKLTSCLSVGFLSHGIGWEEADGGGPRGDTRGSSLFGRPRQNAATNGSRLSRSITADARLNR